MKDTLDLVIKAPLWFYFSATLSCGIILLNFPFFVDIGIDRKYTIKGVPVAIIFIFSSGLFISSAFARSYKLLLEKAVNIFSAIKWKIILIKLPDEARAILGLIEEFHFEDFHYDSASLALQVLRDRKIVYAFYASHEGLRIGKFYLEQTYEQACLKHKTLFRKELRKVPEAEITKVRGIITHYSQLARYDY